MIGDKLISIEQRLISISPDKMQSPSALIELGAELAQIIAYTGGEVARLKKAYQVAKMEAYKSAMGKLKAEGKDVAPSLVKDYVNTMVSEQEYRYILAERLNASATHTLDFCRSCLSMLKQEMATIQNYNS